MLPENTERIIFIDKLNIFRYQRARISLFETRNEKLLKCCDSYEGSTAEEFVYRTQKVNLTDPITPRLRTTQVIDFSTLSGAIEHTIEEHTNTLFKHVFDAGGTPLLQHSIECSASYRYDINKISIEFKNFPEFDYNHLVSFLWIEYKEKIVGEFKLLFSFDGEVHRSGRCAYDRLRSDEGDPPRSGHRPSVDTLFESVGFPASGRISSS